MDEERPGLAGKAADLEGKADRPVLLPPGQTPSLAENGRRCPAGIGGKACRDQAGILHIQDELVLRFIAVFWLRQRDAVKIRAVAKLRNAVKARLILDDPDGGLSQQ